MVSELSPEVIEAAAPDQRPLAVVLWRIGCSTSRYAIPYWDRLAKRHPEARIVAICQDPPEETAEYCRANGLSLPMIADGPGLKLSRSLGAEVVPSFWLLSSTNSVSGYGWDRRELENIDAALGGAENPLFDSTDAVLDFKPG